VQRSSIVFTVNARIETPINANGNDASWTTFRIFSNNLGLCVSEIDNEGPFLNQNNSFTLINPMISANPPTMNLRAGKTPMNRKKLSHAAMKM